MGAFFFIRDTEKLAKFWTVHLTRSPLDPKTSVSKKTKTHSSHKIFLYWIYWITSNLLIWKTLFRTCSCKHVMLALYGHQLYILSHYDNERRPPLHPCLEDRFGSTLVPNKNLYLILIDMKNLLIWDYFLNIWQSP